VKERRNYIEAGHPLSIREQARLLEINRSSLYYKPVGETSQNVQLMHLMDRLFTEDPTLGVLGMQDELAEKNLNYNVKRIRRLLRKMGVEPIYPKKNLSRLGQAKYIHPYLLRGLKIERANQVWAIDITYIPMRSGFMYLTAIIDLYSRYIVGWQISNSLEKETQTELLQQAITRYGTPEIINSDQGSQYTCEHWIETLGDLGIKVSMDGKGRATDNAFIERWFRTIKQKHIYLNPAGNGLELYEGINIFVQKYNRRRHQGIDRRKPIDLYKNAA
jgi:putative transposase